MGRVKVWAEDDATVHDPDHETLKEAYFRLYGEPLEYARAILVADLGDADEYTFPNGAIVLATFPGNSVIFEEEEQ
jgi:hypothetical protein